MNTLTSPLAPSEAAALLQWYADMGVDETVANDPRMRLVVPTTEAASELHEEPQKTAQTLPFSPATIAAPAKSFQGQAEAIADARRLAESATTLAELKESLLSFHGCGLRKTAMNTVFSDGNPESPLMLIGEAPGAEEDKQGIPFCGASGQLLDKMMAAIGLTRTAAGKESFYISNTLFWRPPGNRQPTPDEIEICRPFVEKHIALVNPKLLLLIGGTATKAMLGETRGITRLHGQIFRYTNGYMTSDIETHVVYHPSFLLRQPAAKRQAWNDLLQLKQAVIKL